MTRALWHINSSSSIIKEEALIDQEIKIETEYSLISRGTEMLVCKGLVPSSLQEIMAVPYMQGNFSLPIKYGYSLVGKVVGEKENTYAHCMHPHQSICSIAKKDFTVVPGSVSPKRACLASNMETAVNGMWDARLEGSEEVLILGFGNIGALLAETLRKTYALDITIGDPSAYKLSIAKELGFRTLDSTGLERKFDVVFNTSASNEALQNGILRLKKEGRLVEMSWYGDKTIKLQLGMEFHYNRLSIISSQVSNIPKHKETDWDYNKRKQFVFELLSDPTFDRYISHEIPFSKGPEFFADLRQGKLEEGIIYLFKYD